MIRSMTGFGDARLEAGDVAYHVEVRSVNNRYLKTAVRLPDDYAYLESDIERLIRQRLSRGSVTYRLYVRGLSAAAASEINTAVVRAYVDQLRAIGDGQGGLTIDLATLAALPGVCQPRELTDDERAAGASVITRLTGEALDRLVAMRAVEGGTLAADLDQHCATVRTALEQVRGRAPRVVEEYRDRLHERIAALIAEQNVRLAEEDLLREVAIYAERSDISEEVARLTAHLDQFAAAMRSGEAAGRKLEFIAQEMLREANTMGSKSGDAEISRHIIEIKAAIDRIKEQVLNAE